MQNGVMMTHLSLVPVGRTRILATLLNEGHVCTCPEHNYGVHKYHPWAILLLLIPKFELFLKVTVLLRQGLHTMSRKVSNLAPSMVTVHLLERCPPYSSCVPTFSACCTCNSTELRTPTTPLRIHPDATPESGLSLHAGTCHAHLVRAH